MKAWLVRPRPVIRLPRPPGMTLVTGAEREMIHAVYDDAQRMVHLIVHTRTRSLRR